jgi:cyclin-A
VRKGSLASARTVSSTRDSTAKSASTKPALVARQDNTVQKHYVPPPKIPTIAPCSSFVSPGCSGDSVSIDETMSICDSMKSPEFEYIDNAESSMLASVQRRANEQLYISEEKDVKGLLKFCSTLFFWYSVHFFC